ncbi:hypothetical protein RZS08_10885, partial [Arthrospira platensis SPKY1]|nr:hypothetical protein [Arthrospira platensis SPKY1]
LLLFYITLRMKKKVTDHENRQDAQLTELTEQVAALRQRIQVLEAIETDVDDPYSTLAEKRTSSTN